MVVFSHVEYPNLLRWEGVALGSDYREAAALLLQRSRHRFTRLMLRRLRLPISVEAEATPGRGIHHRWHYLHSNSGHLRLAP